MTKISGTDGGFAEAAEALVFAVVRALQPHDTQPVVFSKIATCIKGLAGRKFSDFVGLRPADFAARYEGDLLEFSRDGHTPPLLTCSRRCGPFNPAPPPNAEVLAWAAANATRDLNVLNFGSVAKELKCDRDALVLSWLRAVGTIPDNDKNDAVPDAPAQSAAMVLPRDDDACQVGSVHTAEVYRVAQRAAGVVCRFVATDSAAGATAFLPTGALPPGTDIEALIGRVCTVTIVSRLGQKILLNLADDSQALSIRATPALRENLERIRDDVDGLLAVVSSLAASRASSAVLPMAERILQQGLARVVRSAIHAWHCRGGSSDKGLPPLAVIPDALRSEDGDAEQPLPYSQVASVIAAVK